MAITAPAALEPGEARDDGAAEHSADLEERALVDHRLDDRPHLVDAPAVARHHVDEKFVGRAGSSSQGRRGATS